MGEKVVFSTNAARTAGRPRAMKVNLDTDLTPVPKSDSKWVIDQHGKCRTIKLPDDDIESLSDLGLGRDTQLIQFGSGLGLHRTSKAGSMKERIDELDAMVPICLPRIHKLKSPPPTGCSHEVI